MIGEIQLWCKCHLEDLPHQQLFYRMHHNIHLYADHIAPALYPSSSQNRTKTCQDILYSLRHLCDILCRCFLHNISCMFSMAMSEHYYRYDVFNSIVGLLYCIEVLSVFDLHFSSLQSILPTHLSISEVYSIFALGLVASFVDHHDYI